MSMIEIFDTVQEILAVETFQQVEVRSSTQIIVINPETSAVSVINAGPQGPPGAKGDQGEPGESAGESIEFHLIDPTPHAVYDEMPSLASWFANQLL